MCRTIAGDEQLTFRSEATFDEVIDTGHVVQESVTRLTHVRRPDRLFVEADGEQFNRHVWYDGRSLTVLDTRENRYARADAPPTIDATLDFVIREYGVHVPLADILFSNLYDVLVEQVQNGTYVGRHRVGEHLRHHLAFQQEAIDWQVWIDAGSIAVLRKLVITYKREAAAPQYVAVLYDWNLKADLSDDTFTFEPTHGAKRASMRDLIGN